MPLEFVPAPHRQFKTYSMIIAICLGSFDALLLLLKSFADVHLISNDALLVINSLVSFLIVPAKLIQQYIPATVEEKIELVSVASDQPLKPAPAPPPPPTY